MATPIKNGVRTHIADAVGTNHRQGNIELITLKDGSSIMVWETSIPNSDSVTGAGPNLREIHAQKMNADGTLIGQSFLVSPAASKENISFAVNPEVTSLADGGYVITYTLDDGGYRGSPLTHSVHGTVYNADNTVRQVLDLSGKGNASNIAVESLDNDSFSGFTIVFKHEAEGLPTSLLQESYYANGDVVLRSVTSYNPPASPHTTLPITENHEITELANGQSILVYDTFMVGRRGEKIYQGQEVELIGANNTLIQKMNQADFGIEARIGKHIQAAALTDGDFVLVAAYDKQIVGQRYNTDGTKDGTHFEITTPTDGIISDVDISTLPNGEFEVTYITNIIDPTTNNNVTSILSQTFSTAIAPPPPPPSTGVFNDIPGENQELTGTTGNDIFVINGNAADYGWGKTEDGKGIVVWNDSNYDILYGFETINFKDAMIPLTNKDGLYKDIPTVNQFIEGTTADETFVINGASTSYAWSKTEDGQGFVVWNDKGYDILTNIEHIRFTDKTVDLNGSGTDPLMVKDIPNQTQYLTGTEGKDVFIIAGKAADYGWSKTEDGQGIVVWNDESYDILSDFEEIQFNDQTVNIADFAA